MNLTQSRQPAAASSPLPPKVKYHIHSPRNLEDGRTIYFALCKIRFRDGKEYIDISSCFHFIHKAKIRDKARSLAVNLLDPSLAENVPKCGNFPSNRNVFAAQEVTHYLVKE